MEHLRRIEHKLDCALTSLQTLTEKVNKMATTLDELVVDVATESTLIDSLITLTTGIKAQLDAALAGVLTPAQQAKVDAIFAAVEQKKADIAAAILANTPTPPAPPTP